MEALEALQTRNASSRLSGTVSESAINDIIEAGLRAPDHALLRPWKIIVVEGEGRERLGALFAQASLTGNPGQSPEQLEKLKSKPMRAPVIFIVAASVQEHPKVPEVEQVLSAGCVAQNMLVAAHAMGLGAIWRTGGMAYDPLVAKGLGLADNQKIVGFIYVGEVEGKRKNLPTLDQGDYVVRF